MIPGEGLPAPSKSRAKIQRRAHISRKHAGIPVSWSRCRQILRQMNQHRPTSPNTWHGTVSPRYSTSCMEVFFILAQRNTATSLETLAGSFLAKRAQVLFDEHFKTIAPTAPLTSRPKPFKCCLGVTASHRHPTPAVPRVEVAFFCPPCPPPPPPPHLLHSKPKKLRPMPLGERGSEVEGILLI